jgi:hypothetical protein
VLHERLKQVTKKYRILFRELAGDTNVFKARMAEFGVPVFLTEKVIEKAPIILKQGLSLGAARRYAEAVQGAGGRVTIQEYGWFEDPPRINRPVSISPFRSFTMCPQCGFKQLKSQKCIKCGFGFADVGTNSNLENAAGH